MPFSSDPALRWYAITTTILGLHLLLLALWTSTVRVKRKQYVNPEDAKLNKAEETEADHGDVQRVKRAHQNAIENFIPFIVIGGLFAATRPSATAAMAYLGTFAAVRILHTVFYLAQKQPFRTLMFAIGVLCTFGMAFHVLRAAI